MTTTSDTSNRKFWRGPRSSDGRLDEVQQRRGGCPSHPEGHTPEEALTRWANTAASR